MSLFGRIVTVVVVATWVFPIYFFAHDMIFAWDLQFVRGIFCGVLLVSIPLGVAAWLRGRRAERLTSELLPPDSEPWRSSKRFRR